MHFLIPEGAARLINLLKRCYVTLHRFLPAFTVQTLYQYAHFAMSAMRKSFMNIHFSAVSIICIVQYVKIKRYVPLQLLQPCLIASQKRPCTLWAYPAVPSGIHLLSACPVGSGNPHPAAPEDGGCRNSPGYQLRKQKVGTWGLPYTRLVLVSEYGTGREEEGPGCGPRTSLVCCGPVLNRWSPGVSADAGRCWAVKTQQVVQLGRTQGRVFRPQGHPWGLHTHIHTCS